LPDVSADARDLESVSEFVLLTGLDSAIQKSTVLSVHGWMAELSPVMAGGIGGEG